MFRRLYYLLPDKDQAESFCEDLDKLHIEQENRHALVNSETQLDGIKDVHTTQEKDKDYLVEWSAWRLNLLIFFLALGTFMLMAVIQPSMWLLVPAAIMMASFTLGFLFTLRIPNVHFDEFRQAVNHGEFLLMLDVPPRRMKNISRAIQRRHPEAVAGGVCWTR